VSRSPRGRDHVSDGPGNTRDDHGGCEGNVDETSMGLC
jgi:hypothetical protein